MSSSTARHHCKKSKVVQVHIHDVKKSAAVFARYEGRDEKPIVLVPDGFCCFAFCITIPDGFWILAQNWLADQGQPPPGFYCFKPAWWRVSHVVTKKGISYNHPVLNCPTKDNVMVEVDVSLIFQIGPTIEEAKKFVYELGAHRFDELLSAETEEAIRALVNRVPVMKVLDLREEFATDMTNGLNSTMKPYGVSIKNVKITNVLLPVELENTLQQRTSFKTKMEQTEKKHSANMRKINDDARQRLTQIKRKNNRAVQDLDAETTRAYIGREERLTNAKNQLNVKVVNAKTDAQVAQVKARSMKDVAAQEGERKFTELTIEIKARCDGKKVAAEQDYASRVTRSEAALKVAECAAEEKIADAEAETKAAKQLQEKRDFIVQNLRMNVLTGMAKNSSLVICGDTGEHFLQAIAPGASSDLSMSLGKLK